MPCRKAASNACAAAVGVRVPTSTCSTSSEIRDLTVGWARNDANTLSAMLKLLEEKGLVERREHPDDRRARAVHLTENGNSLVERLRVDVTPFRKKLCDVVGEEYLPAFLACLRRLSRAAEEAAD